MSAPPQPVAPGPRRRVPRSVIIAIAAFVAAMLGVMGWVFRAADVGPPTGKLIYSDDFERPAISDDWKQSAEADQGWDAGTWRVEGGRLWGEKIHNAALWLQKPLPEKVRIEFDARAESEQGDVKCEVFGDGRTHQSGYILIHGGWNNSINTIARQDEHAEERKEDRRCADRDGRVTCVERGVDYHWTLVRTDDTLRWYLDGKLFLTYPDAHPVQGRHFAFNDWEAQVSFDNLKIYDLSE